MSAEELFIVGRLGRTRGVDGEMFITPETDFPERFVGIKQILVRFRDHWRMLEVESARVVSGRPAIKFKGIDTPEDAARLTNHELAVGRAELVKLPEDTFYHFDLVGCRVFDEQSKSEIGRIVAIESYPANDVFLIEDAAQKILRLPIVREFVKSVDVAERRIEIDRHGLLD